MATVFKVDGYDLAPYMQLAHGAGLDPADSEFTDPQFSGAPAFTEGQQFVGDAVANRVWEVPLILKAADPDSLYQLVREINSHLFQGAQVRFKMDLANNQTFFDLERGRLDVQFEYFIARAGRLRATLRLWTRPYGHTGTTRNVASFVGTGPFQFAATGIIGDVDALANLTFTNVGADHTSSAMVLYGVTANASYQGVWKTAPIATAVAALGAIAATVVGASGAVASQYAGLYVSPNASEQDAVIISPDCNPYGRNRVIMLGRGHIRAPGGSGLIAHAYDFWTGAAVGTAMLNAVASGGRLTAFDLGEWNVPANPTGIDNLNQNVLRIAVTGAGGASAIASPGLDVTAVILLPVDQAAGVLLDGTWRNEAAGAGRKEIFSYPKQAVFADIGGARRLNALNRFRGAPPRLPVTGTSMPSGPVQVVVAGLQDLDAFGNLSYGVRLDALERFTFQR